MTFNWWSVPSILMFLLVFSRIGGLFIGAPLLSNQNLPPQVKIGLVVSLSIILFALHGNDPLKSAPQDLMQFVVVVFQEFTVGVLIGFSVRMILASVQMSGELVSTQAGLTVSNILDPMTQANVPVVGQFYYFMAMVLFLSLNMHEAMLLAVQKSFTWFPIGGVMLMPDKIAERFMLYGSNMYVVALMLAMPVYSVLLVTEIALALTTKVMPQMNIFMVALPFKIMLGLTMLMVSLPSSSAYLADQYEIIQHQMMVLLKM